MFFGSLDGVGSNFGVFFSVFVFIIFRSWFFGRVFGSGFLLEGGVFYFLRVGRFLGVWIGSFLVFIRLEWVRVCKKLFF